MNRVVLNGALRVFLSSTSVDLEPYRERVASLVRSLGQFAVTMNTFPLQPTKDATRASLDQVASCQVYLLLLGWRYGHVPDGQEEQSAEQALSVTHQEYRAARRLGLPCYVFLADASTQDDLTLFPLAVRDVQDPDHRAELAAFRAEVERQQLVGYFHTREELVDKVAAALYDYLLSVGRPTRIPRDLPPRASGFVGRKTELATLLATLRSGQSVGLSALVAGLGGVGKSALAAEALAQVAVDPNAFPGGVSWVRCDGREGLDGLTWVYDQLLAAWGVRLTAEALRGVSAEVEAQAEVREQALRDRLGKLPGPALALLDNIEVAFPLGRALDQLKPLGVTLLVTARHRPSLSGKLRLQTLDVLEPEAALVLFHERYTSQEGVWEAARDTSAAQVVVEALGRLALAVELAAARAAQPGHSVVELAAEVQQPDVLARLQNPLGEQAGQQASVRYSFARSLALLSPPERACFAALGLPAGPDWPRPVITALFAVLIGAAIAEDGRSTVVDAPGPLARRDPLEAVVAAEADAEAALERLVALSLVSLPNSTTRSTSSKSAAGGEAVGAEGLGELGEVAPRGATVGGADAEPARVRLHPLLRALATEEWVRQPAATQQAVRRGLLQGVQAWVNSHTTQSSATYAQLEADEALVVGAMQEAVTDEAESRERLDEDTHAALRAVTDTAFALAYYLDNGGHWQVGVAVWELALQAARATSDRLNEGTVLSNLALLVGYLGDRAQEQRLYEQALAIARAVGNRQSESVGLCNLGILAMRRGAYAQARALYRQALALDRQLDDRRNAAITLTNLGILAYWQGDHAEARRALEQAAQAFHREVGDRSAEANALGILGQLAIADGELARAHQHLDAALPLARASGSPYYLCFILTQQGELARAEGRWQEAERWLDEADVLNQQLGSREHVPLLLSARARLLRDQGQKEAARAVFTQALSIFEALGEAYETRRVRAELAALDATDKPEKPKRPWWRLK